MTPDERAAMRERAIYSAYGTASCLDTDGVLRLLDALDAAEALLTVGSAPADERYRTGSEPATAIPYVGIAWDTEVYDRRAADPMTPIATCDTAEEARDLVARLNTAEARLTATVTLLTAIVNDAGGELVIPHASRDAVAGVTLEQIDEGDRRVLVIRREGAA